jgi:hypothetical protein
MEELVRYCEKEKLLLIVGCDSNTHLTAWGSTNCNGRGEYLLEFLFGPGDSQSGKRATFCNVSRQEVIVITLGSYGLLESIIHWEVSQEPSLLDHRHILFTLRGSVPALLIRNPRGTNWGSFREDLRDKLERGPELSMEDKAGLGLAVQWIQQALVTDYEENCPLRPTKNGRKSLRWTPELASLRREVRRLFNRCRADNKSSSWELYREAQRRYKEVRKASKETLRTFCGSINDLPRLARLHRALSRDPKTKLGSLVAPNGERMLSEGETLNLLLVTHFPDSDVVERSGVPAAACRATCVDWQVAARIINYRRVEWAICSFVPYKSPGMDGIFPALLQEGREIVIPYLIRIFVPAWWLDMYQPCGARLR